MKYFVLIILIAIACGKRQEKVVEHTPEIKIEKKQEKIPYKEFFKEEPRKKTFLPHKNPIALVLVGDTIFHCEKLTTVTCGLNAKCGNYEFNCLKNPTVEYLRKRSY